MKPAFGKDLSSGSIPKNLLKFAAPVFLGSVLSSGYSIINTIWVGHLLGGLAVAAVAVTFPIILLMVAIANSFTTASSVLIAQNFGAKKNDAIQRVVDTSWSLGTIFVVLFSVAFILGAGFLLDLMGTTPAVHAAAIGYLRLTLAQFGFMYLAFLLASTLRAVGNSKVPLVFTAIGVGLNMVLDPLLIIGLGPFPRMGLMGAAVASIAANGLTAMAALVYLWKHYAHSPLVPKRLVLDGRIARQILSIGFPTFVQHTILSVAIGCMTAFVNRFGANATAAFGIAGRIDSLVVLPAIAVMIAMSTMTAQAIGAQRSHWVAQMYRWGLLINTPVIASISLLSILVPSVLMHLFVRDNAIVAIGVHYLHIVGWAYLLLIPLYVSNGVLVGAKKTMVTMMVSLISLGCFRIPLAGFLSHTALGLTGIWIAAFISFGVNALLGYLYYRSGRWLPGRTAKAAPIAAVVNNTLLPGRDKVY